MIIAKFNKFTNFQLSTIEIKQNNMRISMKNSFISINVIQNHTFQLMSYRITHFNPKFKSEAKPFLQIKILFVQTVLFGSLKQNNYIQNGNL
jgi:hypothetical protein